MPSTRGLLKSIKSLVKPAQEPRVARILKPRRLSHKHLFLKNSMKKSILDVKLPKMPSLSKCH
jgi:hypothetical protein